MPSLYVFTCLTILGHTANLARYVHWNMHFYWNINNTTSQISDLISVKAKFPSICWQQRMLLAKLNGLWFIHPGPWMSELQASRFGHRFTEDIAVSHCARERRDTSCFPVAALLLTEVDPPLVDKRRNLHNTNTKANIWILKWNNLPRFLSTHLWVSCLRKISWVIQRGNAGRITKNQQTRKYFRSQGNSGKSLHGEIVTVL